MFLLSRINVLIKKKLFLLAFAISLLLICIPASFPQDDNRQDSQFNILKETLTNYNFTVKLEIPPYVNRYGVRPYGLLEGTTRTVWINPIVFELGNAEATIVHEATHAAQLCAGNNSEFKLLNLDIVPPKMTHPYFMRYHNYRREIEAEAYTVQVQPNKLKIATEALKNYCASSSVREIRF